jgi:serine/threonine-protein kinase HipA
VLFARPLRGAEVYSFEYANPVEQPHGHSLLVSDTDNAQDLDLAREVAAYVRVDAERADTIVGSVVSAVQAWPDVAKTIGLSRREQDEMAPAFARAETSRTDY